MNVFRAAQAALYERLSADPDLSAKAGVYDEPPGGDADFPYVTIGDADFTPWGTMSRSGYEVTATIHVWSRYKGYKETNEILGDIDRLLARQDFPVQGYVLAGCYDEDCRVFRDPDGLTRHGVARYRLQLLKGDTP